MNSTIEENILDTGEALLSDERDALIDVDANEELLCVLEEEQCLDSVHNTPMEAPERGQGRPRETPLAASHASMDVKHSEMLHVLDDVP